MTGGKGKGGRGKGEGGRGQGEGERGQGERERGQGKGERGEWGGYMWESSSRIMDNLIDDLTSFVVLTYLKTFS